MAETLTWTKEAILKHLQKSKDLVASSMIKDLIATHNDRHEKMKQLYGEYKGRVPILEKKPAADDGVNNCLPHDFRGEIVDQKTGYSFGNPITYTVDSAPYAEDESPEKGKKTEAWKTATKNVAKFVTKNQLQSLDNRTGQIGSICGSASRLLYIDGNKEVRTMHYDPWETIFIKDATIDTVVFAMIYYKMQHMATDGSVEDEYTRVEWYDDQFVYFYNEVNEVFELDKEKPKEQHHFKMVPLLEFPNKPERQGDFEKVREIVNSYDLIQSNNIDELEAFRLAYLIFYGVSLDDDTLQKMKEQGGLEMDAEGKAEWLTKEMQSEFVENVLNRLRNDAYRFAKAVDMSDEKFSGSGESGESRKWKLKTLTDDAMNKEREFELATKKMFEVINTHWKMFTIQFEPEFLKMQFTPNLPADLLHEAETTSKLKGNVSEETRLGLLSFVDNPINEIIRMNEEANTMFDEELQKLGITASN